MKKTKLNSSGIFVLLFTFIIIKLYCIKNENEKINKVSWLILHLTFSEVDPLKGKHWIQCCFRSFQSSCQTLMIGDTLVSNSVSATFRLPFYG